MEFLPDSGSGALVSDSSGAAEGPAGSLGDISLAGELVMTGAAAAVFAINTVGLHNSLLSATPGAYVLYHSWKKVTRAKLASITRSFRYSSILIGLAPKPISELRGHLHGRPSQ